MAADLSGKDEGGIAVSPFAIHQGKPTEFTMPKLMGHGELIFSERDRELVEARERRRIYRRVLAS